MKLRVIVLLQITAICAILVHDSLARYDLIDLERTWSDTLWTSLVTLAGGTLSAGGSNAINMWHWVNDYPAAERVIGWRCGTAPCSAGEFWSEVMNDRSGVVGKESSFDDDLASVYFQILLG